MHRYRLYERNKWDTSVHNAKDLDVILIWFNIKKIIQKNLEVYIYFADTSQIMLEKILKHLNLNQDS